MTTSTNNEPKTIFSWASAIALALESEGIDSQALFKKAGVDLVTSSEPSYRIETVKITEIFRLAVEATGITGFGLLAGKNFHPGSFHAFGYSLYASNNLNDFCQRIVRYFRLLSDNGIHTLTETKDDYVLDIEIINTVTCDETIEGWLMAIVQMCRHIFRPNFNPLKVQLVREKPEIGAELFEQSFKCPVEFSSKLNAIHFAKEYMFVQLPAASSELARVNDEIVIQHLARLDRSDIVRQVETKIIELLPTGECNKERIASLLNMSPRNMHGKLEQRDTSYQEILDDLRSQLAIQYIEQDSMSISQITYQLGFTDTSNFSRAFRRWTGHSPSEYRKAKAEN